MTSQGHLWRVRFDLAAWDQDLRGASATAREHAERWRLHTETTGGIPHAQLHAMRAEDHGGLHLPNCVKVRIPDPYEDDPRVSPWGAVLRGAVDAHGAHLSFLAFGIRHPAPSSQQPSVYQRAHRRLLSS